MASSDNTPARTVLAGVALIALLTAAAWAAVGKYAVFVPIALIPMWRFSRALGPRGDLAAQGWSGRRFKNYWVYEEQLGRDRPSISLRLELADRDRYVLVVPSEQQWRDTMPMWAVERRDEILERVLQAWAPEDVRWPAGEAPLDVRP
jgi:hypothetical protein